MKGLSSLSNEAKKMHPLPFETARGISNHSRNLAASSEESSASFEELSVLLNRLRLMLKGKQKKSVKLNSESSILQKLF